VGWIVVTESLIMPASGEHLYCIVLYCIYTFK